MLVKVRLCLCVSVCLLVCVNNNRVFVLRKGVLYRSKRRVSPRVSDGVCVSHLCWALIWLLIRGLGLHLRTFTVFLPHTHHPFPLFSLFAVCCKTVKKTNIRRNLITFESR